MSFTGVFTGGRARLTYACRDQAFHLFLRRSLRDPAIQDPVEDDLSLSLFGRLRYRDGNEGLDGTWRAEGLVLQKSLIMVVLDGSRDVCIVAFHLRVLERNSWLRAAGLET